jgi:hypothetical protein
VSLPPPLSTPASLVPDPATVVPEETIALEATAATAVTAVNPASFPDFSAAAPVAALEAALAVASMTAPSEASTTLGAMGTPVIPATEPLQDATHLMSPIFFVF